MIDAALEVLQVEREKVMEVEEEDCSELGNDSGALVMDITDETDQLQAPADKLVDNALEVLVHNATEEFGFAPRDVYRGIFDPHTTRRDHAKTLCFSTLQELVRMFCWYERLDDFADYVVAVYPHSGSGDSDYYSDREMDLKSIRIAGKAVESMRLEKHERLREAYHYFHRISVGPNLAGWVFKAIIHRMFSGGWSDGSAPQPIRMVSNNSDPPVFSADLPSVPDAWLPSPAPLSTDTRAVTLVNFTHGLNDVTLDKNNYYIPIATTNPLFDSFTID